MSPSDSYYRLYLVYYSYSGVLCTVEDPHFMCNNEYGLVRAHLLTMEGTWNYWNNYWNGASGHTVKSLTML